MLGCFPKLQGPPGPQQEGSPAPAPGREGPGPEAEGRPCKALGGPRRSRSFDKNYAVASKARGIVVVSWVKKVGFDLQTSAPHRAVFSYLSLCVLL